MGHTRDFLNTIEHTILVHQLKKTELITKYCDNPQAKDQYSREIEVHDKKCAKELRDMLNKHIAYLQEKDPYGRAPLNNAEKKIELFLNIRHQLSHSFDKEDQFIQKLADNVAIILKNKDGNYDYVDTPRWPPLKLNNMLHFFKSIWSNKTTDSEKESHSHKNKSSKN